MTRLTRFAAPLLLALPLSASALDFHVTTLADQDDGQCTPAHCSLREAVSAANASQQGVRIILGAGEYRLERANEIQPDEWPVEEDDNRLGDVDVYGRMLIVGQGAAATRLNGQSLDRLFHVHPGAQLELRNLALINGRQIYDGGALLNRGQVRLNQVEVLNSSASAYILEPVELAGNGGGVANYGEMEILRSTFRGNSANGEMSWYAGYGGAVYNMGQLMVRDSLFQGNRAADYSEWGIGGALYNQGTADIARTTFASNRVAWSGYGAAIANAGQLRLTNSTLSGNTTVEQGVLENGHPLKPELNAQSRLELMHVTISGNVAWGLTNRGEVNIRNSIIAGNRSDEWEESRNCRNLPGAYGYSARGLLLGTDAGGCVADSYVADDTVLTHQMFPLQENNGSLVHPLRRNSLAIDAGVGSCSSHDQRGLDRQRDGNGDGVVNCDLGAFERAYP